MKRIDEHLLAAMREHILGAIADKSLFNNAEQQEVAARVAGCHKLTTLTKWLATARQEARTRWDCHRVARERAAAVEYVRCPRTRLLVPRPVGDLYSITCLRVRTN